MWGWGVKRDEVDFVYEKKTVLCDSELPNSEWPLFSNGTRATSFYFILFTSAIVLFSALK